MPLSDPEGPTGKLCSWIESVTLNDIPKEIRDRAKYIILDGLGCALVGAHLPWSEKAANVMFDLESDGTANIFGWERRITPLSAALLNSSFLQGFELDDWHSEAPLHSNSILLPALFAAIDHLRAKHPDVKVTGRDLLLATIVGFEVGPRVGLALYGSNMLTRGWHSGAVFGPAASAAAVSKLLKLPAGEIEDALGIACTQACGLMSAQFESDVKRMQHGFAARNGLLAAMLASGGYVGIKKVFERPYGGFLAMFSQGSGMDPPYKVDEIVKELGSTWKTLGIRIKPYASMAGTHPTIDCVRALQVEYPDQIKEFDKVKSILIEMSEPAFEHGGWTAKKPLTATGAQMSNAYAAATQLVDEAVLSSEFRHDKLERQVVWELVEKTTCKHFHEFKRYEQRVTIEYDGLPTLQKQVNAARGVDPALTADEICEKYELITKDVAGSDRLKKIETFVVGLESQADVGPLTKLLSLKTENPIA